MQSKMRVNVTISLFLIQLLSINIAMAQDSDYDLDADDNASEDTGSDNTSPEDSDSGDSDSGDSDSGDSDSSDSDSSDSSANKKSQTYSSTYSPDGPARSVFWKPLGSFVLPGMGQYLDGQTSYGLLYSGVAVGGIVYADYIANSNGKGDSKEDAEETKTTEQRGEELSSKDNVLRKIQLASQVTQVAGGFSAYHSFQSSAKYLQKEGEYQFLNHSETPADIMLAPFQFKYLARSSTLIPLGVIAGITALQVSSADKAGGNDENNDYERDALNVDDMFFAGAFSVNAGTHEEAVFRGWLHPVLYEKSGSPFWSNVGQAGLFSLAHLTTNSFPVVQLLLGYHLGNVTMDNNWTISESVFIHTWWDVFAFTASYLYKEKIKNEEVAAAITPILWAPPLIMVF